MKLIKIRLRNRLGELSSSCLMKIAIEYPETLFDSDLEEVVTIWNKKIEDLQFKLLTCYQLLYMYIYICIILLLLYMYYCITVLLTCSVFLLTCSVLLYYCIIDLLSVSVYVYTYMRNHFLSVIVRI